jgi:hypothetical protein
LTNKLPDDLRTILALLGSNSSSANQQYPAIQCAGPTKNAPQLPVPGGIALLSSSWSTYSVLWAYIEVTAVLVCGILYYFQRWPVPVIVNVFILLLHFSFWSWVTGNYGKTLRIEAAHCGKEIF